MSHDDVQSGEREVVSRRQVLQTSGTALVALTGAGATAGGGTSKRDPGTREQSEIADWNDLDAVREDTGGDYVLVADLDETTAGYDQHVADPDSGWEPIGEFTPGVPGGFTGAFDGDGHQIAGLTVDRPGENGVGLFGSVDGTVERLDIVGCDVTGGSEVGALAGRNTGAVVESSATGTVTGTVTEDTTNAGGLIGYHRELSDSQGVALLENSSAAVDVTGARRVGGLANIEGGVVVRNSHYNVDAVSINGETILTVGGLFDDQYADWQGDRSLDVADYDSLAVVDGRVEIDSTQGVRDALGFVEEPGRDWRLGADVDLSGDTILHLPYLAGDFDGNGHTVTLNLDQIGTQYAGFIGINRGTITELTVDGDVTGGLAAAAVGVNRGIVSNSTAACNVSGEAAGGLVSTNRGVVSESVASGSVTTEPGAAGGLVTFNSGLVRDSTATGDVTVNGATGQPAGGLVAVNLGTVRRASASGEVSGGGQTGGLVGRNFSDGEIAESSATGTVSGGERTGGLVGLNGQGSVRESFATGAVSGSSAVGALVGQLGRSFLGDGDEAILRDAYWDTDTTGQSEAVGTIEAGDGTAELRGEVAGRTTAQLQGETATENMQTLDFETTWQPVTDDYPEFREWPPSLPEFEERPQDLDDDGLYEDIDGNGQFDIFDVQALFTGLDSDPVQNNPAAFTFSDATAERPEEVTVLDVQGLFVRLD
jgi:hypothetical protein